MKLTPITKISNGGDIKDVLFNITIIIDKDNEAFIVDNSKIDYKDFIDCNTLAVKKVEISII